MGMGRGRRVTQEGNEGKGGRGEGRHYPSCSSSTSCFFSHPFFSRLTPDSVSCSFIFIFLYRHCHLVIMFLSFYFDFPLLAIYLFVLQSFIDPFIVHFIFFSGHASSLI